MERVAHLDWTGRSLDPVECQVAGNLHFTAYSSYKSAASCPFDLVVATTVIYLAVALLIARFSPTYAACGVVMPSSEAPA